MKARIKFRKYGIMRFIGHLDVMRYFQKAMRRAEIPIAFTGGYSPHMIMYFAQPLGVGLTSDGEYLDLELAGHISSRQAVERLNQVMVEGMEVVSFLEIPEDKKKSGMTVTAAARYEVWYLKSGKSMEETRSIPAEWKEKAEAFLWQEQILVWKKTKRSEKEVDIRPMIEEMEVKEDRVCLLLAAGSEANLKPDLLMETFMKFLGIQEAPFHYHRVDLYARAEDGSLGPLEDLGTEILDVLPNRRDTKLDLADIDTVIFDIGNVLIDFAWEDYLKTFPFDPRTREAVADAMFRSPDWDAGDSGLVSTEEWLALFLENAPEYEQEIRQVFGGFGASIVPYEFTCLWIQVMKERGMRLYFLSNYSEEMYRQSKEQLSFLEAFDGGIFSWKERCMKPDPRIYRTLLERYDIAPERAVFFDDRPDNVEAARREGIRGIVFTQDIPLQFLAK